MISESEAIAKDEWLIRLIWEDFWIPERIPIISKKAFEPRKTEIDGISLFRRSCLNNPLEVLMATAHEKRSRYGLAQISVAILDELGLNARVSPIQNVTGHVVLPELNSLSWKSNKVLIDPKILRLATVASQNIIRPPLTRT